MACLSCDVMCGLLLYVVMRLPPRRRDGMEDSLALGHGQLLVCGYLADGVRRCAKTKRFLFCVSAHSWNLAVVMLWSSLCHVR